MSTTTPTTPTTRCTNAHIPGAVSHCCGLIGPKGERPHHTPPTIHEIEVGQRVRSFDFASYSIKLGVYGIDVNGDGPDRGACYYEGEVVDIIEHGESFTFHDGDDNRVVSFSDCNHYAIRVTRLVINGAECSDEALYVFPPVNGARTWRGFTFGVQPMGWSLEDTQEAVTEAGCDWQGAEEQIEDAYYALQQAQDRVNALVEQQASAIKAAEYAVAQADALGRDEANEVFNEWFGYYAPESS